MSKNANQNLFPFVKKRKSFFAYASATLAMFTLAGCGGAGGNNNSGFIQTPVSTSTPVPISSAPQIAFADLPEGLRPIAQEWYGASSRAAPSGFDALPPLSKIQKYSETMIKAASFLADTSNQTDRDITINFIADVSNYATPEIGLPQENSSEYEQFLLQAYTQSKQNLNSHYSQINYANIDKMEFIKFYLAQLQVNLKVQGPVNFIIDDNIYGVDMMVNRTKNNDPDAGFTVHMSRAYWDKVNAPDFNVQELINKLDHEGGAHPHQITMTYNTDLNNPGANPLGRMGVIAGIFYKASMPISKFITDYAISQGGVKGSLETLYWASPMENKNSGAPRLEGLGGIIKIGGRSKKLDNSYSLSGFSPQF